LFTSSRYPALDRFGKPVLTTGILPRVDFAKDLSPTEMHRGDRLERAGYSDTDLEQLASAVDALLVAEGLPSGSLSNFSSGPSQCRLHSEKILANLHLSGSRHVQVEHCGCDHFYFPVDPPPEGIDGMAADLVADVLWYWERRHEAEEMIGVIRDAVESEFERDRSLGHPTRFWNVSLSAFQTYYGRLSMSVRVDMQLMRHGLFPIKWFQDYKTPADVKRFFRSNRLAWRQMAEQRDERAKVGAVGAIDTLALHLLRHAGWDPSDAVRLLLGQQHGMPLDLGEVTLVLGWQMQTLKGSFDLEAGVSWKFGDLMFSSPTDVVETLRHFGVPIEEYYDQSQLAKGALVSSITSVPTRVTLSIDPPLTLFGLDGDKVIWIGE
jgi:hypothetical protein